MDRPQSYVPCAPVPATPAILPLDFSARHPSPGAQTYLGDPRVGKLAEFFQAKGLAAIKDEDRREQWYADWIAYQAEHRLYASVLTPRRFSADGSHLDLLKLTRFLEVFAYFSPAHGYSLQVSFLGFFAILMGDNDDVKRQAAATLESGGLLAFAVSEQAHGADLLGGAFVVRQDQGGRFIANGSKYYIGNANAASMMCVLAREEDGPAANKRSPLLLFALRPKAAPGFANVRKIHTFGVRSGFVGAFDVNNHAFGPEDLICRGRGAWDAVFGAVTLGKFFLGFGSIGICEHALSEATAHLSSRILYGKPAIDMPHLRTAMAQAFARLTAMKLYAYRALDYVQAAAGDDRRYLLFAAVQKARVSTQGVAVMALLSECMGAKAFEADGYFEMALRDAPLLPSVEGSTHINLGLAARFIRGYFSSGESKVRDVPSLVAGDTPAEENPYLMAAETGSLNAIAFGDYVAAYQPLISIPTVAAFAKQAAAFAKLVGSNGLSRQIIGDPEVSLLLGRCLATIAYGQLVAENSPHLGMEPHMIAAMFHLLCDDLTADGLALASLAKLGRADKSRVRRMIAVASAEESDWNWVAEQVTAAKVRPTV